MTTIEFLYWLQGFFELSRVDKLTSGQAKTVLNHIDIVKIMEDDVIKIAALLNIYEKVSGKVREIITEEIKEILNSNFEKVTEDMLSTDGPTILQRGAIDWWSHDKRGILSPYPPLHFQNKDVNICANWAKWKATYPAVSGDMTLVHRTHPSC